MSVYCFSDIHGNYNLWQQIKEFIKPEDKVYCLGDCTDRGLDGLKILKEVYEHPQITLLKGNHEDMLVKAAEEGLEDGFPTYKAFDLLTWNGGYQTYLDWAAQPEADQRHWLKIIKNLPNYGAYTNINGITCHLSHAGFDFPLRSYLEEEDLLWDRNHFKVSSGKMGNHLIIHGHTPVDYVKSFLKEWKQEQAVLWYDNFTKVDIDCETYKTNSIVLLDLDTFEEHIFKEKK